MNYLFAVVIIIVAGCFPSAAIFSQGAVHHVFTGLSPDQVRSEFEDYERRGIKCAEDRRLGKKCVEISFSVEKPLNIQLQGSAEPLTFRVSIMTPRSKVRETGYEFGKVARQRTAADRADILDRLVSRMQAKPTTIVFVLRLINQPGSNPSLPGLTFAIENENSGKLWSASQPDFSCSQNDIVCQAALERPGQQVVFPLLTQPGNVPFVIDTMKTLTLVVVAGDVENRIQFELTGLG